MTTACTREDCGGTILADGYCNTCGYAPKQSPAPAPSAPAAAPSATVPPPAPAAASPSPGPVVVEAGSSCVDPTCSGAIAADGYCDTCGLQPSSSPTVAPTSGTEPVSQSSTAAPSIAAPVAPTTSRRLEESGWASDSRRSGSLRTTVGAAELGAGLVTIAPTEAGNPAAAVMSDEKLASVLQTTPEPERFCKNCERPVGRGTADQPGRSKGFCGTCRTPFDFITNDPKLAAGDLVAGQYEILGPIAHGGMGWIYLGKDTAVSDRWVVLKGLLNEDDPDAVASAVAERQFLARIQHGSIVNIYNFVTWEGAGYIVMEYVGGASLNSKLKDRRRSNGGVPDPLPVQTAIAYMLGVLPALGYLHRLGLVYNDLKPANVMAVDDTVKLIDVGGVMQADDHDAAIFGTQGFQAPEVASMGPSVASDLYTVGRTLAVLSLNFVFHDGPHLHGLPGPAEEPLFDRWESLYRFLLKATAAHPDDRFQTADEMAEQLRGVLQEIVAISGQEPRPTSSDLFGGDQLASLLLGDESVPTTDWRVLPLPKIDPADPGAAFLYDLPDADPYRVLELLDQAVSSGTVPDSSEVRLRRVRELIEAREDPETLLRALEAADPWDWRVTWYRSVVLMRNDDAELAAEGFSRVWTELPGELAPKLAVALAAERAGRFRRAADVYSEVIGVDASYVSAAFGLARCRAAAGDRRGAIDAYRAVPASSATFTEAQVASAKVLAGSTMGADQAPTHDDIAEAATTIEQARIDAAEKSRLAAEVLERALGGMQDGSVAEQASISAFGNPLTEIGIRQSLEATYRELARVAATAEERFELVDKANAVRPKSLV